MSLAYTTLVSGSSGNASFIENDRDALILDAGLSYKKLAALCEQGGLCLAKVRGVLLTHEHLDHSKGAGVLARKLGVALHMTRGTYQAVRAKLGKLSAGQVVFHPAQSSFQLKSLQVASFPLHHDALEPCGYLLSHKDKRVGFITDTGHTDPAQWQGLKACQGLVVEANHDVGLLHAGPYPAFLKKRILSGQGHLSNLACQALLNQILGPQTRYVTLAHLSSENNRPQLAQQAVRRLEETFDQVSFNIAPRHQALPLMRL